MSQTAFEAEIAALIARAVNLEEPPASIDPEARLFNEGLGLDSIDVLELAVALGKKYGVKTKADDAQNRHIFSSVNNLARFVAEQRAAAAAS